MLGIVFCYACVTLCLCIILQCFLAYLVYVYFISHHAPATCSNAIYHFYGRFLACWLLPWAAIRH